MINPTGRPAGDFRGERIPDIELTIKIDNMPKEIHNIEEASAYLLEEKIIPKTLSELRESINNKVEVFDAKVAEMFNNDNHVTLKDRTRYEKKIKFLILIKKLTTVAVTVIVLLTISVLVIGIPTLLAITAPLSNLFAFYPIIAYYLVLIIVGFIINEKRAQAVPNHYQETHFATPFQHFKDIKITATRNAKRDVVIKQYSEIGTQRKALIDKLNNVFSQEELFQTQLFQLQRKFINKGIPKDFIKSSITTLHLKTLNISPGGNSSSRHAARNSIINLWKTEDTSSEQGKTNTLTKISSLLNLYESKHGPFYASIVQQCDANSIIAIKESLLNVIDEEKTRSDILDITFDIFQTITKNTELKDSTKDKEEAYINGLNFIKKIINKEGKESGAQILKDLLIEKIDYNFVKENEDALIEIFSKVSPSNEKKIMDYLGKNTVEVTESNKFLKILRDISKRYKS